MLEQSKTHIRTERGLCVGRKEPNTRTTALAANYAVQTVHVAVPVSLSPTNEDIITNLGQRCRVLVHRGGKYPVQTVHAAACKCIAALRSIARACMPSQPTL